MKITLITVGKIKEKYFTDAIAEYSKRLSRYVKLEIIELADEKTPDHASAAEEEQIKNAQTKPKQPKLKKGNNYERQSQEDERRGESSTNEA